MGYIVAEASDTMTNVSAEAEIEFICDVCTKLFMAHPSNAYDEYGQVECMDCWACPTCHGEQWGIIGVDWEMDDPINGPYDGDVEKCPNCGGSGKWKDATYF
jgi:hypothetical protein